MNKGFALKKYTKPKQQSLFEDESDEESSTIQVSHKELVNQQLSTIQKSQKAAVLKQEEDPSVYDYDGVYDQMKSIEKARKMKSNENREARYVHDLLKAAERRRIEQERIMDRKAHKERELEGDEFKDKEMFITSAYKERQLELERLEKEESSITQDMTGFYRNILDSVDRGAVLERPVPITTIESNQEPTKVVPVTEGVKLNASEEILDKRQLLKAGLNISKKKEQKSLEKSPFEASIKQKYTKSTTNSKALLKEQQRRIEQAQKATEIEKLETFKDQMAKKTDEKTVSDARQRYLERKRKASSSDSD